MKLTRQGLVMEELIDDDWETLLIILEELYESEDIVVELLTALWTVILKEKLCYSFQIMSPQKKI